MSKFAIIETGGKQYRVSKDDTIRVEKLPVSSGEKIEFDAVLLTSDGERVTIGTPHIDGVIKGLIISHGKGEKKMVFRYKNKTRRRTKRGHRQPYTEVKITGLP